MIFLDVTPLTLGIETVGGVMTPIIQRGTIIPAKKSQVFSTHQDQQTQVTISVNEGERTLVKDNHHLGKFDLSGIPPAARGVPQIEVTFEIDENSILTVTAFEKGVGKAETLTITSEKGRLTQEEIERMVAEAEEWQEEDRILKERIDAKHSLENYLYTMRNTIEDRDKLADKLSEEDKSTISEALDEAHDWLRSNPEAAKYELEDATRELQSVCDPIIAQIYQGGYTEDEEFDDL